jgi:hypothetical protein
MIQKMAFRSHSTTDPLLLNKQGEFVSSKMLCKVLYLIAVIVSN